MITVREILHFLELQKAVVHAGKNGLGRKVRWAHVMDTEDVGLFLEGGEFLLTCGQVWPPNKQSEERLLNSFLRSQISGILFATGRYLTGCPAAALEFGEKNAIPVIEVPYNVPFVKITEHIHLEIIDRHNKKMERFARVPIELREKLQFSPSYSSICQNLADYLNCPVAITDAANQIFMKAPPIGGRRINFQKCMHTLIHTSHSNQLMKNTKTFYLSSNASPYAMNIPIKIEGKHWGTLWLISPDQELKEEFAYSLDFAADLLVDLVLNNQDLEAKRRQLRLELLELLLENHETASILVEEKIHELGIELHQNNWLAGLIRVRVNKLASPPSISMESIRDECKKWMNETDGMNGFCEIYKGQLVLFLSSNLDKAPIKQAVNHLQNNLRKTTTQTEPILVLGEMKQHVLSFRESYQEAKALAPLVLHQSPSEGAYFSDQLKREMFLYGELSPKKAIEFRNIILPNELLTEQGIILYETLKCLALNNYNRDKVTKELHIHLNTLRYRIKKIEQLFEESLTSPRCQFWIQVALDLESLATEFKESDQKSELDRDIAII
ncbi:PucR family transcriptional regulator [Bacillus salipaludis]|uniref:PucR family transcriptional regulator n=1 Tax=Bacillus salipaludis TaxID=2547811 RepID=UPI002E1C3B2F|nr:PucR family transcriptional regulator ligand-binding domain-containing protein [Bacillus salipaludis]